MKRTETIWVGGLLLLGGSLLYVGVHIAAVLYMPQIYSWYTPPGRYMTALADSGGSPMFWLSILLIGIGLLLLGARLFEALRRKWRNDANEIRLRGEAFDANRAQSEEEAGDRAPD